MTVVSPATEADWSTRFLPFRRGWFETEHGRLHYVDHGPTDAPALVCLHGNPTWSFYYRHLIRALSNRYRVIALDHLGCGLSDKPDSFSYRLTDHVHNFGRLVQELGLSRYVLAVHDWGGAIGFGRAVEFPDELAGICVFNTAAFRSKRIPMSIALCRLPVVGSLGIQGMNGFLRVALLRCVSKPSRLTSEVVAGYLAPYDSWGARKAHLRFVQDIPLSPRHPSYSTLQGIEEGLSELRDHPMVIMWGGRDFCFDDSFYEEWRKRFPSAHAHHLDDCGHFVLEDGHEFIVPRLERFLDQEANW
ncbi:MAG: alpha/beta fold hydrolase [Myxococcota bacterium]